MTLFKKLKSTRGFTLAELMIVVAIISILAGIAFIFVNPKDISYVEYNRSAEAIATAVQNRLTEIRNTGDMQELRKIGVRATQSAETGNPEKTATPIDGESSKTEGGYRYVYNYKYDGGAIVKNYDINYILPFGAIEYDLAQNYYAIGFQSDTGMVGEVFYSAEPFKTNDLTADYLVTLAGDPAKRKAENVGYYKGDWDDSEVAFANLPTPQLTITNYEELTLSIYLPKVKQLETYNKRLGFVISISDEDGKAYENGITINQTAIYSTFSLGNGSAAIDIYNNPQPIVAEQEISSGETYNIVLDTVKKCDENDMKVNLSDGRLGKTTAKGNFESWAVRSQAFKDEKQYFLLGDNSTVTVTVYCLYNEGEDKYDKNFPVDPTFMPRSASLTFNGWFNNCIGDDTVEIACGRHLQNLEKLTELRKKLVNFAPKAKDTDGDGVYEYEKYDLGMAYAYTEGSSEIDPHIHESVKDPKQSDGSKYYVDEEGYLVGENGVPLLDNNGKKVSKDNKTDEYHYLLDENGKRIPDPLYNTEADKNIYYKDITEKYVYRSNVLNSINKAKQVNAIDFDCAEWKENGKPIPFTPINLPYDFYYYGNYLTINNLYVNAPFYAGLFGYAYQPYFYDILLVNPSVTSQAPAHLAEMYEMGVGALIGTSRDSHHINNCQVYMTPEGGKYNPDKRVQGECYVGGLIGFCEDERIENCSASVYTGYAKDATKTVVGEDGETTAPISSYYVGGLIGCITGDSSIKNCYAAGNLSGNYVGGLVGFIVEDSDPSGDDYRIESCYTAGHIEYATYEAAGLLGRISERAGNAKAALSAKGNYCVIIYGQKNSADEYEWQGSAPIYGTFKGDGFEWMGTDDSGYYDAYLKGEFGAHSYFAGAVFENNSKNYYIAQRGIYYSGTSYLHIDDMGDTVQDIINKVDDAAKDGEAALTKAVADAQNKLYYLKKLQALEELKSFMEEVIKEVDNEPSTNANGTRYVEDHTVWLETDGVEIHSTRNYSYIEVTATQAIHAIYDGNFTGKKYTKQSDGTYKGEEKTYTNQAITYEGSSHPTWLKSSSGIDTYTFMGFYNALKNAYKTLMNTPEDDNALKMVTRILGEDTGDTSKKFYQDGLFYQIFRSRLFYNLFQDLKDYYEDEVKDKNGELLFRHYRDDYSDSGFRRLLCDLGMTQTGRENMLNEAKIKELEPVLDALKDYPKIVDLWEKKTDSPMKGTDASGKTYATAIKALASTAQDKVQTLYEDLGKADCTLTKLQEDIKAADEALSALYNYYDKTPVDKDKDGNPDKDKDGHSIYVKDLVDAIDKNETTGDMRKLRDPLNSYRRSVYLCGATSDSGIYQDLDVLKEKLGEGGDIVALVEEFVKNAQSQLNNDSGHRLKNAEELRNAARGFVNGDDTEIRDETLGFMYDYGNSYWSNNKDINPYTNSNSVTDNSFVDEDNGIYNNVFPYIENQYTRYYPFPFVYARDVEDGERVLYVLFHYGDWLTEDLWAAPTVTYHTDYPEGYSGGNITLSKYRVTNVNSFAPDEDIITSNDENIDTPFYFEGWYVDEDRTTPYDEDTFRTLLETAAINGEEKISISTPSGQLNPRLLSTPTIWKETTMATR